MFDDFDTMRQSDEYYDPVYQMADDLCDLFAPWEYEDEGYFTEEEQESIWQNINEKAIKTGININDCF